MYMKWRTGNETKAYSEENICDDNRGNDVYGDYLRQEAFFAASNQTLSYTAVQADPAQPTTQEPATTQADINTKDDKDTQSEAVTLNIDNENQYDGMEKPYAQAMYQPMPTARSALYFLYSVKEELRGNTLRAALDLGDAQTAPFVFKTTRRISGCRLSR